MDGAPGHNPYPGLRPFQADETHLFFGRDEQRIELLHRLRRSRFLAIVGTSGSGKSSLVRAGLLPGLHGGFMAGQSDRWRVVDLRPGADAIGNLARALDAAGALRDAPSAEEEPSFTEATLRRSGLGLVEAVREARLPGSERVLVLVDQFEELFRALDAADRPQSSDDANAFVKLLLEAAKQGELPIYVVLTMRSDFLGECSRFRDLPEAINDGQYLVPRLTPDQRTEAITGPASVCGVVLSSTLVNRLLNDVGDNPDQLPILQHALMRTWAHWQHRPVDAAAPPGEIGLGDYEEIGGMARALSLHADSVFDGLGHQRTAHEGAQRKAIAEKLFKRLAGVGAGGRAVRRLAKLQEIVDVTGAPVAEVISVIEAFRAPGHTFLMPPASEPLTSESYIDISHESLIRNWVRMKTWVDDEAESARVYARLSSTAVLHEKGEAGLWDQPDLGVALKWRHTQAPNPAWAQRYNTTFAQAMAFLDASQARVQAAQEAQSRRRRLWALSAVVVFCVMLAGILAWGREELARVDDVSRQVRMAPAISQYLRAIVDLHRAGKGGAVAARDASLACAPPPENLATVPGVRQALLDRLCGQRDELSVDDQHLIRIYDLVLQGRWRDASLESSQASPGDAATDGERLLDQLARMRWPADRVERRRILELRDRRNQYSPAIPADEQRSLPGSFAHPVHHRIAEILVQQPPGELAPEENLLLDAYRRAEASRSAGAGAARREQERTDGRVIVERMRVQPNARAYADMALVALTPESTAVEDFETSLLLFREYGWVVGLFMLWPLWRLWRFVQRRLGRPVRVTPHPLRCAVATLFDVVFAVGIGVVAGSLGASAVAIAGFLFTSADRFSRIPDAAGFNCGLVAGIGYILCRDAIRLRFRRSIGKAIFDLRPLMIGAADPGAMTLRASVARHTTWLVVCMLLFLFMRYGGDARQGGMAISVGATGEALAVGFAAMMIVLLADVIYSWFRGRDTFVGKWSKTRVIDADSAEAQAIRP